jgi:sugar O-acyltransferase (sialic acid O-acetyltransferase NeuD family)
MNQVIIFGAAEYGEVALFYLTKDAALQVAAFTVDDAYLKEESFCGRPVIPFSAIGKTFPSDRFDMLVALGYTKLNAVRAEKCAQAKNKGYRLINYVSSKASTWPGLSVGENCFILEDNTIQPFVTIGNNVTLWSGNHIGHHASIGDNCFITSHVVVSGGASIGDNCFIGVNATIRDHVRIGRSCVIGAGSLILQDADDFAVYTQPGAELSKVPSTRLRKI